MSKLWSPARGLQTLWENIHHRLNVMSFTALSEVFWLQAETSAFMDTRDLNCTVNLSCILCFQGIRGIDGVQGSKGNIVSGLMMVNCSLWPSVLLMTSFPLWNRVPPERLEHLGSKATPVSWYEPRTDTKLLILCTLYFWGETKRQIGNNRSGFLAGFSWSAGFSRGAWRKGEALALNVFAFVRDTHNKLPDLHPTGSSGQERNTGPARQWWASSESLLMLRFVADNSHWHVALRDHTVHTQQQPLSSCV